MRNIRVYLDQPLNTGATVVLGENAHRHCHKVLRLRQGDEMILFNGDGCDYQAIINDCSRSQTTAFVKEKIHLTNESPLEITLLLALLKGEAIDRSLQKSVELGVSNIIPFSCARSERHIHAERMDKKQAHWQGIICASAMQCGRATLPQLHQVCSFADALSHPIISTSPAGEKWIFSPHHEPNEEKTIPTPAEKSGKLAILIGPEGGFTPAEVDHALTCGFKAQTLGPRILRADTAAIAAMVRAQLLLGDF